MEDLILLILEFLCGGTLKLTDQDISKPAFIVIPAIIVIAFIGVCIYVIIKILS